MTYDPAEQQEIASIFAAMLAQATGDGGKKRATGEKPVWTRDPSHEAALFSHLNKWKHGELVDPDSGAHPLVHLAWRALAIAYQERNGFFATRGPASGATPTPRS
jgi:hypothetical protein